MKIYGRKQSMSEKVLARRKHRRALTAFNWAGSLLAAWFAVFLGYSIYNLHKQELRNKAPTWADFVPLATSDVTHSYHTATTDESVPTSLIINGELWSLVRVNHFGTGEIHPGPSSDRREAQTYCDNKTIAYIQDMDTLNLKRSIMHEVFHAGACLHGGDSWWNSINPTNDEHIGVYHLGEFTATFLHDNPLFAAWEAQ